MNPSEHKEKIIELLNVIARRPAMYFGSDDNVKVAKSFLYGFDLGLLRVLGDDSINLPAFHELGYVVRGWELRPSCVTQQMRERELTDREIVLELIQISTSCWKEFFKNEP